MAVFLFLLLAASPGFDESFRAGVLALQRGELAVAESKLQAAAAMEPTNARAWIALAQALLRQGKAEKAEADAAKAAKLGGGDAVVLQSLAIYYSETGETVKEADARAALAGKTGRAEERDKAAGLYFSAAQALLRKEKFAEAVSELTGARERVGANAQIELALGVAYYGLRRFDDAASAFLRTIAIDPSAEQPYLFLGKFLDQITPRLPEVERRFVEFEKANPAAATGYLLHAKALNAAAREPEAAVKMLERSISIDGQDASAHFELGSVLDRLQRFGEATREYEKAEALNGADAATHYRLARDYDRIGKPEMAQAEREKHRRLIEAGESAR